MAEDHLSVLPEGQSWRRWAACRPSDVELFFPRGTTGAAADQIAVAKSWCSRCVVSADCLAYALSTHQGSGVWGGMTEDERRVLRRRGQGTAAANA